MTRDHSEEHRHDHHHGHGGHGHTHGAVDPTIATSERGIWAVKWSFVALVATALLQLVVVVLSGSVALLSDTIHNFAGMGPPTASRGPSCHKAFARNTRRDYGPASSSRASS